MLFVGEKRLCGENSHAGPSLTQRGKFPTLQPASANYLWQTSTNHLFGYRVQVVYCISVIYRPNKPLVREGKDCSGPFVSER